MTHAFLNIVPLFLLLFGAGLDERVKGFHEELRSKGLDSYSTRDNIRKYFLSDDDLSNFIVAFLQKMHEKGFREHKITGWQVISAKNYDEEAVEEVTIKGKGLLFFTASFIFKEEWVKRDGEWYFLPPKVIPLGR